MTWSGKKLAGIGCGVLVVGAIVAAGALTWYSTQLAREYRKVRGSEKELAAAAPADSAWTPPADGVPPPGRLEAFVEVRSALAEWRQRLAAENRSFGQRQGNWWTRAADASDLAQVLAGYWLARNEALEAAAMGPHEYAWLYGLVYHGWLGFDVAAGRQTGRDFTAGTDSDGDDQFARRRAQWEGGVSAAAAAALEPLRDRLAAGWTEATNPVELLFVADAAAPDKER